MSYGILTGSISEKYILDIRSTGVLSNCPLVITVICILTGMFALFGIL